jgi:hypothetical protein
VYHDLTHDFVVWYPGVEGSSINVAFRDFAAEFRDGEQVRRVRLPLLAIRRQEVERVFKAPLKATLRMTKFGKHWYVVDRAGARVANCGRGERGQIIAERISSLWNAAQDPPSVKLGRPQKRPPR